jgi:predicted nucleic acid-binding protein
MAAFVIDASAALAWCFSDEASEATNALLTRLQKGDEAVVPAHWPAEVANALLMAVRRQRISSEDARRFLEDVDLLPIRIDIVTQKLVRLHILPLAEKHALTVYDAAYLELAMRQALPLATFDNDLRRAAQASGVSSV